MFFIAFDAVVDYTHDLLFGAATLLVQWSSLIRSIF